MFDISFSNLPSRSSMFINLVYNEDKIISFLYVFISIYILKYDLSRQHIVINVMQNIQKKGNIKNNFLINICEKLNLCEY